MHGILAYGSENIEGLWLWLIVAGVTLLLALFAVFYAIEDEPKRAIYLIAPAVIYIVFMTLYCGHAIVKAILKGNSFISEHGLAVYIIDVVHPWISSVILHSIVTIIVCLILWFKSRQEKRADQ